MKADGKEVLPMARRFVGLDLGTAHTRIWTPDGGVTFCSPSAAAIESETHQIVALGADAREMLGKTPAGILAFRPIKDSVVSDFEVTSLMLKAFFTENQIRSTFRRPSVIMSIPYRITEAEQLAAQNAVLQAGARAVGQIPSIYAAAVGAGLRVMSPRGRMIVDIGAGTTEVAVISAGGIISAKSSKLAGERFDLMLINYLRTKEELLVGDSTAEELKIALGEALPCLRNEERPAYGRHARTGMGACRNVSSEDIYFALRSSVDSIARFMLATLEDVPPEISADIQESGFMLCGGSAKLPGIAAALARATGLQATLARYPESCVIRGLGMIIRDNRLWSEGLNLNVRSLF